MPIYDRRCKGNGCADGCSYQILDRLEPVDFEAPPCPLCGGDTERFWKQGSHPAVIPDEIPGGIEIRHGICNEDGTPRRYYSHSEMKREAKRRGLENLVEHVPTPGSDKSPYTTRWSSALSTEYLAGLKEMLERGSSSEGKTDHRDDSSRCSGDS